MYEVRDMGGVLVVPLDLPMEDALPELRRMAEEHREKLALHRVSDGAKLAVAAPFWRGVNTSDTRVAGDPKFDGRIQQVRGDLLAPDLGPKRKQ